MLKMFDRTAPAALETRLPQMLPALEGVNGSRLLQIAPARRPRHRRRNRLAHLARHLVLRGQRVGDGALDHERWQDRALVSGVDQAGSHPHAPGRLLHGAFDHQVDAEPTGDLADRPSRERLRRGSRRDPQVVDAAQAAAEIDREAVPERDGVFVSEANDIERQHRHRCGAEPRIRTGRGGLRAALHRVDVGPQRGGRQIPILGALGQQRVDDAFELWRMVPTKRAGPPA